MKQFVAAHWSQGFCWKLFWVVSGLDEKWPFQNSPMIGEHNGFLRVMFESVLTYSKQAWKVDLFCLVDAHRFFDLVTRKASGNVQNWNTVNCYLCLFIVVCNWKDFKLDLVSWMVFRTGNSSEQQQQKYIKQVYLTLFFPTEIMQDYSKLCS